MTMETIIHVARDAARGISHLHRQNLVHLDIKVRSHGGVFTGRLVCCARVMFALVSPSRDSDQTCAFTGCSPGLGSGVLSLCTCSEAATNY